MKTYLFLAAHMDDETLCCGGTIAKLKEQGEEVYVIVMSQLYNDNNHTDEFKCAMSIYGIDSDHYDIADFETRNFNKSRQQILQYLIDSVSVNDTDLVVFTHSKSDIHADHSTLANESLRAFKKQNLITYTAEWNQLKSESNYYIEVSEEHMAKKLEAMVCYKSQQHRPYFDKTFTYSRALLAGAKIGVKYAEPFRIVNMKG
jgi:LmbE family N-acetylglucosaminyl deacetylase